MVKWPSHSGLAHDRSGRILHGTHYMVLSIGERVSTQCTVLSISKELALTVCWCLQEASSATLARSVVAGDDSLSFV